MGHKISNVNAGLIPGRACFVDAARVREVLRREGPGGVLLRALRRTVGSLFWCERVGFFEADLTLEPVRLPALTVDVEFIEVQPKDLLNRHALTLEVDFGLAPQEVARRVACRHVALFCLHEGVPISMSWLAFNAQVVSEVGRTMLLRPGEALTYNELTLPAWRGHGLGPHLNQFADEHARQRAATRRITWRMLANGPAMRVAGKLGHRLFSVATTVRVLGVPQVMVLGLNAAELRPLVRCP